MDARDNEGQTALMTYFASTYHPAEVPDLLFPDRAADDEVDAEFDLPAAIRAVAFNLSPICNDLLLELLGQRDDLGRTCLWLLFSSPKPLSIYDKVLAVAKMEWLTQRLTTEEELARCAEMLIMLGRMAHHLCMHHLNAALNMACKHSLKRALQLGATCSNRAAATVHPWLPFSQHAKLAS